MNTKIFTLFFSSLVTSLSLAFAQPCQFEFLPDRSSDRVKIFDHAVSLWAQAQFGWAEYQKSCNPKTAQAQLKSKKFQTYCDRLLEHSNRALLESSAEASKYLEQISVPVFPGKSSLEISAILERRFAKVLGQIEASPREVELESLGEFIYLNALLESERAKSLADKKQIFLAAENARNLLKDEIIRKLLAARS